LSESIAPAETTLGWGDDEFGRTAGFNRADLKQLVLGDISGVLIPKAGLKTSGKREIARIEKRWTGLKQDHLKRCAIRAKERQSPGVIVASLGRNKAEIVSACISRGFINHLLIDQDLADELPRWLDRNQ